MQIRNARADDYPLIINVVDHWWGGQNTNGTLPKMFFLHFQQTSFVAEVDDEIIAFLVGFLSQTWTDEAYIYFAGVHPDYRSRGIAKLLYERFFTTVQSYDRHIVRCVTSPVNASSIKFHFHLGFEIEEGGSQIADMSYFENYDGPGEDRVLLRKRLDQE
jgi:ribosomal protein S18 acetylase RimI-like enzyme